VVEAPKPAEPEKPVEVAAAEPEKPAEPEITQPKLQNVTGAVIIRRGDTLWRISRRVYGKGIRYSTIYVANKPQIEDPDRIWPGQVFAVPGKSQDGQDADWSAIADQMQQDTAPATVTR
jgi:nucleoid-associated protein YgaU